MPQIFKENSSYYLLAIRSAAPAADNQFRHLEVKVKRPNLDVRARSGYFVTGTKAAAKRTTPAPTGIDRAMAQPVPAGDLPLAMNVTAFATPGKRDAAVAVRLHFREPMPAGQRIDVVTMTLDPECGECRRWPTHRQSVTLGESLDGSASQELLSRLALPPGRYEIRVAATTAGHSGSVFTFIEIPNFAKDRFSASGLALSTGAAPGAQQSLLADVIGVLPTARRDFRANAPVTALLRLYQSAKTRDGVRINATIRDTADHRVRSDDVHRRRHSRPTGSTDYTVDLPLSKLNAGGRC